jgi:hypothetical protein
VSRLEGSRFRDPAVDAEFTVTDAPDTTGLSVAELDRERVSIEYDDGTTQTVPHERFRGRMTYERVDA